MASESPAAAVPPRGVRAAPRRERPPRPGPVRIVDVARAAGVSVATASKALNGRSDVAAGTREQVQRVAEALHYTPNPMARSLPAARSFSVGLMTTDSYGRFAIPLLLGAEDALGSGDLAILFCDSRDDPERERRQLRALEARRVDGIIVNGRRTEPRAPLAPAGDLPVVYAFTPSTDPADASVVADEAGGARLAVGHLVAAGRRRVAHVTGPRGHRSAQVRARAAADALHDAGRTVAGRARYGAWSEAWGREAIADLLVSTPDLDAVFCGSDQIARGVLDGLRAAGRTVPDDVAVVGFDNWAPMALGAAPPLTTVDMRLDVLGRLAGELLLAAIDGRVHSGATVVPSELVVRGSAP